MVSGRLTGHLGDLSLVQSSVVVEPLGSLADWGAVGARPSEHRLHLAIEIAPAIEDLPRDYLAVNLHEQSENFEGTVLAYVHRFSPGMETLLQISRERGLSLKALPEPRTSS